jgi:Ring finger domain
VVSICVVCLDDIEISIEAKELPCKHHFHGGCILPVILVDEETKRRHVDEIDL